LLQAGHLAILACKHDAAQLATHIVFCLDKPPTIHFAIAKLNCRRIGNTKDNCVGTNSSCYMAQLIKLKRYALLTRNDVPLCFVQQFNWKTDAAHR
jgi:hypothetical protein